jgi:signal transduction histidine kinase
MLNLVSNLLDVSVIESGKLELVLQNNSFEKLIDQRIRINKVIADRKNIRIHKQFSVDIETQYDKNQITQVIDNLLGNAIKFSPRDANIHVNLERVDGLAKVSVRDEGPGIPLDEQSKLFQGFQRTSVRPTGGEKTTGLGLAIIKKIMEAHKGNIGLLSQPGNGSTFYFCLPLA